METYRRLETPVLYAWFNTVTMGDTELTTGSLVDPATSIKIIIEDSSGQVVQALADMTQYASETGKYYYNSYTIAVDAVTGVYDYEVRGADGSKIATGPGHFEVIEQVA